MKNSIKIFFAPLFSILLYFLLDFLSFDRSVSLMLVVTCWMALWWIMETVHYAVTALLPFFLFPLLNIMDAKSTAGTYMDSIIFLFIGGFIIAFAIEKWELHKRFSLKILLATGVTPPKALAGVMLSGYFISMWISNTATVLMLIPAVLSVVKKVEPFYKEASNKIASALLLGLAYSATIGGTATIVGTPPNMVFAGFYNSHYPDAGPITFTGWLAFGLPVSFILLAITFFILKKMFLDLPEEIAPAVSEDARLDLFRQEYRLLGKMGYEEKIVLIVFILTALLWFFRNDIDIGFLTIPGWSGIFPDKKFIDDSTVAVFMAVSLFLIPSTKEKGKMLMGWEDVAKLPFGIILLFGGGFALAKGFDVSGLTLWLSAKLHVLEGMHLFFLVLCICAFVTLLSEFASNTACIQLALPILMALSSAINLPPLLIMIPATFAASYSFMLPIGTPPNTIVFGTGMLKVKTMVRAGLLLDIAGMILLAVSIFLFGSVLLD